MYLAFCIHVSLSAGTQYPRISLQDDGQTEEGGDITGAAGDYDPPELGRTPGPNLQP